jgi:hypothetical protein
MGKRKFCLMLPKEIIEKLQFEDDLLIQHLLENYFSQTMSKNKS